MKLHSARTIVLILSLAAGMKVTAQSDYDPGHVALEHVADREIDGLTFHTLFEDRTGYIWVGTNRGLWRHDGYDWVSWPLDAQTGYEITGITQSADGLLWLTTPRRGIVRLDLTSGETTVFDIAAMTGNPAHGSTTSKLHWFDPATLFIATRGGFCLFNTQDGAVEQCFEPHPGAEPDLADGTFGGNHIRDVAFDPSDRRLTYLATARGVIMYHLDSGRIDLNYGYRIPALNRVISSNNVEYTDSLILAGTWGAGLALYDRHERQWSNMIFESYESEDLGMFNVLHELLITPSGDLFYGGWRQAGRVHLAERAFILFGIPETHRDNAFTELLLDYNGYLWSTSLEGLFRTDKPVAQRDHRPFLMLTSLTVDDREVGLQHGDTSILSVKADYNGNIAFRFALINPPFPEDIRYTYRLDGVDEEWLEAGSDRVAYYRQLRGGRSQLQVRAATSYGQVIERTLANLSVETPFFRSIWFALLAIALVTSTLYYLYSEKLKRIRLEERLNAEFNFKLSKMEMESLRSQMNPHFIFNSLNSIKNYVVNKGPDEAADYLTKFARLIRVILENSKSEILTLEQEIEALRLYIEIECMRFKQKFAYEIDIDPGIDQRTQLIPPMLIQPHVENAIWHGLMHLNEPGKLTVRLSKTENGISCVIQDNGIGRAQSAMLQQQRGYKKRSLGMQITNDRIATINEIYSANVRVEIEDLVDNQGQPAGTRVTLMIDKIETYAQSNARR